MNQNNIYLKGILQKYEARNLGLYTTAILRLKTNLVTWASSCFLELLDSGSRAKGTAISLSSDVDYFISLSSGCNVNSGGLKAIYESLFSKLKQIYPSVRRQNVSVRINLGGLEVDVTPGRKHSGSTNNHSLYLTKTDSWTQTNIQTHISDVSQSGWTDVIKLLKIWRELHGIEFPSVYLEYLLIDNILQYKDSSSDYLADNFWYVLTELEKDTGNPLSSQIVDPGNSSNILSNLMTENEKNIVINTAKRSVNTNDWGLIVW